jgi:hypothetical protein
MDRTTTHLADYAVATTSQGHPRTGIGQVGDGGDMFPERPPEQPGIRCRTGGQVLQSGLPNRQPNHRTAPAGPAMGVRHVACHVRCVRIVGGLSGPVLLRQLRYVVASRTRHRTRAADEDANADRIAGAGIVRPGPGRGLSRPGHRCPVVGILALDPAANELTVARTVQSGVGAFRPRHRLDDVTVTTPQVWAVSGRKDGQNRHAR